jgi:hypothetical protein
MNTPSNSSYGQTLLHNDILLFQGNRVTVINAFTMTDMALCGVHIMVDGRALYTCYG